ncbi:MAG: hypothetical protein SFY81_16820 [Verrucomicrobiota bacterium]|nr:hypothetical protein [Verrucomicrobiota bacterium]
MGAQRAGQYKGQVVYNYAYDLAYDMGGEVPAKLLGQELIQVTFDSSKRNPRHMFFYRPLMARMPATERMGPFGPIRVDRTIKLLPMGAISITVRVPFTVQEIGELVAYHDLEFSNGALNEEIRRLAEEVRKELAPYMIQPVTEISDEEAYTVFCIEAPVVDEEGATLQAEEWLHQHRREVAGLLTQERDPSQLSDQEADESTVKYLSYYGTDLVVVDWDAALIIDEPGDFHETLYIMEIANLQLAELEAYDRILDLALERSYRDLRARSMSKRRDMMNHLREIRIDLARFSDELVNITKFFGDWYLAKIYDNISSRFHLADWHKTIDEKLKTLDQLYQIANHDQSNRWMLVLELTIVLLFIIDLIILMMGLKI